MTVMISTTTADAPVFPLLSRVGRASGGRGLLASVGAEGRVLFEQTVPRRLVHRAAVSEVFLTDLRATGETTFHVGAQLPRGHGFYALAELPHHDPMLFAETVRQAVLVIAHRVFDVPMDWKFLMHEKSYLLDRDGLELGDRPANIVLVVSCVGIRRRSGRVAGMRMEFRCYRDGERIGSADLRWSCVSPAAYTRLRGTRAARAATPRPLPAAVAPRPVGRGGERDVVLSALPGAARHSWAVRIDRGHPILFDHPVDHVPGMVLMEAARQAAHLVHGRTDVLPVGCRFAFERYAELDTDVVVTALPVRSEIPGALGLEAVFDQDGTRVATGRLDLIAA